ncbi:hypothetical protein CaCOL14_003095 [Colletotrichum acutatum]
MDAIDQAVWMVVRSVQSFELNHSPMTRLSTTGVRITTANLVTDQSSTSSSKFFPLSTSCESLLSSWCYQSPQASAMCSGTRPRLYVCRSNCRSAAPLLSRSTRS